MRFGLGALVSIGLLVGCEDAPPPDPVTIDPIEMALPDCPGGVVVTSMAGPLCGLPTPDAGRSCEKASDCSGHCLADTMSCSVVEPQIGCFDVVLEVGQVAGLCVD